MAVEQAEHREPENRGATPSQRLKLDSLAILVVDKDDRSYGPSEEPDPVTTQEEKPYSIYTRREKWFIVGMASSAALFSPLSANIYFPAIPTIAAAFNKSTELINLTVTVYMVLQGVSPMFWGSLADRLGRRPILLICLLILNAACIGLALVPTSDYWLLMLLRCIQAAGSASTIALGAGVIGDISTRADRGGFFGLFNLGTFIGPSTGPVIGGALAQTVGWRWIFWLLSILSAACFLTVLNFFPETLRRLVGNGSVVPAKIYRPLVPILGARRQNAMAKIPTPPPFSNPLWILTYLDMINLMVLCGIAYGIFYAVTATLPTLFQSAYPFLNVSDIGLCFLAIGVGTMVSGLGTGKLLDREYRKFKGKIVRDIPAVPGNAIAMEHVTGDETFPIEQARMRLTPFHLILYTACCAGYGWCLEKRVNIAVPLVLLVALAISGIALMNTVQTLLVDLLPTHGSSVTACNNLVRCALAAAMVSVIDPILKALGTGWTFVLLAGISLATSPMIWFAMRVGPRYRATRHAKQNVYFV